MFSKLHVELSYAKFPLLKQKPQFSHFSIDLFQQVFDIRLFLVAESSKFIDFMKVTNLIASRMNQFLRYVRIFICSVLILVVVFGDPICLEWSKNVDESKNSTIFSAFNCTNCTAIEPKVTSEFFFKN